MELKFRGDIALSSVAESVDPESDMLPLIAGMWEIMYANNGCGLAANQVGELVRVIVVDAQGFKQEIINPVITKRFNGKVRSKEGCLSFPNTEVFIKRDKRITVTGFSRYWKPVKFKLNGLAAMCVQHEIDHLNGVTIA